VADLLRRTTLREKVARFQCYTGSDGPAVIARQEGLGSACGILCYACKGWDNAPRTVQQEEDRTTTIPRAGFGGCGGIRDGLGGQGGG
jgi:hypothetical protein